MFRANGTSGAKLVRVIETKANRGLGTKEDPVRVVIQYWDLDGTFLAESDAEHCMPIIIHEAKAVKEAMESQ